MAGKAQLLAGRRTELAFFLPGPLAETYEKTCRDMQRRLVRWHGLGGIVQAHSIASPSQDKGSPWDERAAVAEKQRPPERRLCVHLPVPAPRPCKGKISFYVGLISDNIPIYTRQTHGSASFFS